MIFPPPMKCSTKFLFMNDDYYFLRPLLFTDCAPFYEFDLKEQDKDWFELDTWHRSIGKTFNQLNKNGFTTFHFDGSHCPQPYNKYTFQKVMNFYDWKSDIGYTISNLYLNSVNLISYCHIGKNKVSFRSSHSRNEVIEMALGKIYLNHNDAGLNENLKSFLQESFPEPSRFEK